MVPVQLVGVFPVGPENFMCALLEWEEQRRFVPLWLPPIEGAMLAARLEDWAPRRPDAHEVMADIIANATTGIAGIELTNYHQGTFMATLSLEDGTEIDMRASDALLLALATDTQVEADETVLQQASMHLTARDAREVFGIDLEVDDNAPGEGADHLENSYPEDGGPSVDPDAFEAMMRELGMDEDSFGGSDGGDQPSS